MPPPIDEIGGFEGQMKLTFSTTGDDVGVAAPGYADFQTDTRSLKWFVFPDSASAIQNKFMGVRMRLLVV